MVAKKQQIRTKPSHACPHCASSDQALQLGGWLDGKRTYLWVGTKYHYMGSLGGQNLYRLAKAIVRRFEEVE